jgi:long-chain acyl-CoA synthetase
MEFTRTFEMLDHIKHNFPDKDDVISGKENGKWIRYSIEEYSTTATYVSYGLYEAGLRKGDLVVTISNNRPEWNITDMALSQAGMIHVPVYPTISREEYNYILNHCEPKVIIVSDKSLYEKIMPVAEKVSSVIAIMTFNDVKGARNWKELYDTGRDCAGKFSSLLEDTKESIKPSDPVTIIYTSGTTGTPKGVMLSHSNIISNVIATSKAHDLGPECKSLSFLPLSHIYERIMNYHFQYKGISIYYAENMGTIIDNLKEIRPQIFSAVPRVLEKVYDKIMTTGKGLTGIKKAIFFWAVNLGLKYKRNHENGWLYDRKLSIARKLVFSKWMEALGGRVQIIISGSASLQPRLSYIFGAAGIELLEGYGLTETSPVIAVNKPLTNEVMLGTVGPVLEGVEVKLSEDGEILCKGPNVMLGYYKDPQLTKEVIDKEGWFSTGDIGTFIDNKYLKITDRKKEMFKLSSGKYIAPQVIENKLKESMFIEQVMVIGENQKFASAVISPNFPFLHNWASMHHINFRDNQKLIENPQVQARIQREVSDINKILGQTEQIKRFRLVKDEWTPDTGELSPTLKLKRKFLSKRYHDLIKEIYLNNEKI